MTVKENAFVAGQVWVNGALTPSRLVPYIGEFGFWLYNKAGGWGGPHFDIRLLPPTLSLLLTNSGDPSIACPLSGGYLGKVDECSGYAAADIGTHTRHITSASVEIKRHHQKTRFEFSGETGPLDLTRYSVRSPEGVSSDRSRSWTFQIWFEISDESIPEYFKHKEALSSMQKYVGQGAST